MLVITQDRFLIAQNNSEAGIRYDPSFTEEEAFQFRAAMPKSFQLIDYASPSGPLIAQTDGLKFVVTARQPAKENRTYRVEIYTPDINQRLVIQVLDYNPNTKEENVTFFSAGANAINEFTPNWQLPEDLSFSPIVSSSQRVTIQIVCARTAQQPSHSSHSQQATERDFGRRPSQLLPVGSYASCKDILLT